MRNDDLAATVKGTITRRRMLSDGERVLVAVSGGPDSVAMLSVLSGLAAELDLSLHVFHLNHILRPSAAEDADFVHELAASMGLPSTIETLDVPAYCRDNKCGVETGAREVRYRLMEEIAEQAGAGKIATGHTLDDQAETFLMRLVRGSGPTGLRAIPPVRGPYIRPLIDATREQVLDWCKAHGLAYRTDETNADTDQLRNMLRAKVIPVLREANPGVRETIARAIEILGDEDDFMRGLAAAELEELKLGCQAGEIRLDRARFATLPAALARRVLRQAAATLGADESSPGATEIEEVLRQLRSTANAEAHLSESLRVWAEYSELVVARLTLGVVDEVEHLLNIPGRTEVPELDVAIEARVVDAREFDGLALGGPGSKDQETTRHGPERADRTVALDADKIDGTLTVTRPKPGDRFRPFGMTGTKKLQDFFVDAKVPKRSRSKVPIIRCDGGILWVVGYRIDDRFRIDGDTRRILLLEV